MWGGRIETGTFWKDARIMVNDRTNGVITVITNDKERFFFGSPGGGDFFTGNAEYGYLVPEKTRTLTDTCACQKLPGPREYSLVWYQ